MLTKSLSICDLNHILKHLNVSLILFVLLVKKIDLLKLIVYVIIVHIYYIILLFCFLLKKLVTIEVVLLHKFIDIRCCFRFYAWLVTYVIYIAETPSNHVRWLLWDRFCLQVWEVPEKFLIILFLVLHRVIVQVVYLILEKCFIL